MKTLIIVIFSFSIGYSGYSQYTSIPDANFENYLEQNGMGDGVSNNGQVLTSNINTVTELLVNAKNISNLTGIEDFISLERLGCAFNNLTELDLSNNQQLIEMGCTANSLTTLIITQSPNLEILYCDENFLTELDLTQNPNLIEVYCDWNMLTELDITQNTNLSLLWCDYNFIEGFFDTSNNTLLTSLTTSHNNISAFDLSQNVNLISFGTSFNPLQSMDVRNGNNQNIGTFVATETTGELKCILVDDANATYLDGWLKDAGTTFVNNQAECDALGLADATLANITMYPNPATNAVFLKLPNNGFNGLLVTVTNNLGQVLETKEPLENTAVIPLDVSAYPAGIYFVTLKSGKDTTTKKLVVQ
jgi:hypothetical protein